jgi:hypothetical protein
MANTVKVFPPISFLLDETFRKMALFSSSRDWLRYESVCVEVLGRGTYSQMLLRDKLRNRSFGLASEDVIFMPSIVKVG